MLAQRRCLQPLPTGGASKCESDLGSTAHLAHLHTGAPKSNRRTQRSLTSEWQQDMHACRDTLHACRDMRHGLRHLPLKAADRGASARGTPQACSMGPAYALATRPLLARAHDGGAHEWPAGRGRLRRVAGGAAVGRGRAREVGRGVHARCQISPPGGSGRCTRGLQASDGAWARAAARTHHGGGLGPSDGAEGGGAGCGAGDDGAPGAVRGGVHVGRADALRAAAGWAGRGVWGVTGSAHLPRGAGRPARPTLLHA